MSTSQQPVTIYKPKKILQGANLYSRNSILVAELDASVSARPVDPQFLETGLSVLNKHRPEAAQANTDAMPPLPETLAANTFSEVLGYLALTLQRWCGLPVNFARVLDSGSNSQGDHVVIESRLDHLATAAGQIAAEVCLHCMNPEFVTEERISNMVAEFDRVFIGGRATQIPFIRAAEESGIPWLPLTADGAILAFGQGSNLRKIHQNYTSDTSFIAAKIASDKFTAANILRSQGIPVPRQVAANSIEVATEAVQNLGYPVVVKSSRSELGNTVTAEVRDVQALSQAFNAAAEQGPVIVEKLIPGDTHRLVVINGKFRSAHKMVKADQGISLEDVTGLVHPVTMRLAERASAVIDLDIVGLDLISSDISKPYWEVGAAICAVNVSPQLLNNEAKMIFSDWYVKEDRGRIVTVVVLDPVKEKNRGQKIAEQLQSNHSRVCLATKEGMFIDGEMVSPGNFASYHGLQAALCEPGANAVVLEIDSGELISNGLGIDRCDLSVFGAIEDSEDQKLAEASRGILSTISECVLENSIVREGRNASLDAKQLAREINSNLS
ncbi:MAG: ATP-grasp domain-containing protein [Gammaproteobacteria bacterium]|nr:ATP-grasp domain-containing protein [Gammaproteobacteria bacterium]